ncbi:MAG: DUF2188 domain-containing protein [Niastella sp.]|nr:DUF2188 domain-containing protein [Niastella sp.]
MAKKTSKSVSNSAEHVIPLGNGWVVKNSAAQKFTAITDNKRDAITIAREIAKSKGRELIIHGKDGNIISRKSYAA